MARFSVGGEADEGSSSQIRKKLRIEHVPLSPLHEPEEELHDEESSEEEEESSEEDEEEMEEGEEGEEEEEEDSVGVTNQTATSEPRSSNPLASTGSTGNGRIFLTLTDPEVLDCPICYESLTIPVFQCENGHIACTSCCKRIAHKCPSCLLPIGYNRCRAIEKVLESVKVPCQNLRYGCREMVNYSKKFEHEKMCNHAPYSCPVSSCKFVGSCKQLYQHFSSKHKGSAVPLRFNATMPLFFTLNDKTLLLQEEKGVIFILNNREESPIGNVVSVNCIAPPSHKEGYFYEVTAKSEGSNLRFQSFTKNIRKFDNNDIHPEEFLMVPRSLFGSYGQISLDLHIRDYGVLGGSLQPAHIIPAIAAVSRIPIL
ncbi:E3 ubiquitin-protein ligase SINA-like 10 [Euphorbia lathyris]|uniref:E3 ubiquitin-protein ligase SINA-like 10 n=1 Tax=Euphorbia lathyris TaxID=212925 RepID=UPI00331410E6